MLIITPNQINKWQHRYNKNSNLYLAVGDSWFSCPGETSNIIDSYSIIDLLSEKLDIVNYSHFGDTLIGDISTIKKINQITNSLSTILHESLKSDKIKGLFISAGGNDLIDNIKSFIINSTDNNQPKSFINELALDNLLKNIKRAFVWLIMSLKEHLNDNVTFYIHTYDYITNLGEGFNSWFTKTDSWIWSKFNSLNITNKPLIIEIMKIIIDKFYNTLVEVSILCDNVKIIDLRNTITDPSLFENEIHLSRSGMKIMVEKFFEQFKQVS